MGGKTKHLKQAYETGKLIGLNVRVVDDLLDGDGCQKVENREEFLEDYIRALETGKVEKTDKNISVPLRSAETMHNYFSEQVKEPLGMQLRDMKDLTLEEDKKSYEGYLNYVNVAGGHTGELTAIGLSELPNFEITTENVDYLYDLGFSGQVIDDIYDGDVELEDGSLENILEDSLIRLEKHDRFTGNLAVKATPGYNLVMDLHKSLFGDY